MILTWHAPCTFNGVRGGVPHPTKENKVAYLIYHMDQCDDQELMHMPSVKVHNEKGYESDGYYHYQSVTFVVINDEVLEEIKKDTTNPIEYLNKECGWSVEEKWDRLSDGDKEMYARNAVIEAVIKHINKR